MTTQTGKGDDIHLISDDRDGECKMWCGAEFVPSTESLAEATCLLCLKAAKIYGEGAATRLQHLETPTSTKGQQGITALYDEQGNAREVRYLTDDRDARDGRRMELCIGWGDNGDWYVVTVPEGEHSFSMVRLCTSGGASSAVPGFVPLIADVFRKLVTAAEGGPRQ